MICRVSSDNCSAYRLLGNSHRRTAFGQLDHDKPYLGSLQSILDYADSTITAATRVRLLRLSFLSLSALNPPRSQRFPFSLVLRSAAFAFYETALDLPLEHGLPVIVFPSATFAYTALLGGEVMSVSRVCGLNAKYALFLPLLLCPVLLEVSDLVSP